MGNAERLSVTEETIARTRNKTVFGFWQAVPCRFADMPDRCSIVDRRLFETFSFSLAGDRRYYRDNGTDVRIQIRENSQTGHNLIVSLGRLCDDVLRLLVVACYMLMGISETVNGTLGHGAHMAFLIMIGMAINYDQYH